MNYQLYVEPFSSDIHELKTLCLIRMYFGHAVLVNGFSSNKFGLGFSFTIFFLLVLVVVFLVISKGLTCKQTNITSMDSWEEPENEAAKRFEVN